MWGARRAVGPFLFAVREFAVQFVVPVMRGGYGGLDFVAFAEWLIVMGGPDDVLVGGVVREGCGCVCSGVLRIMVVNIAQWVVSLWVSYSHWRSFWDRRMAQKLGPHMVQYLLPTWLASL